MSRYFCQKMRRMNSNFFSDSDKMRNPELMDAEKGKNNQVVESLFDSDSSLNELIRYSGNIKSKITLVSSNLDFIKTKNTSTLHPTEFQVLVDSKLSSYLKPFRVIGLNKSTVKETGLGTEDQRLHIDTSKCSINGDSFNEYIKRNNYKPVMDLILNTVLAYPRQYVIFIGEHFKDLMSDYASEIDRFSFILTSPNRVNQKNTVYFTRVCIEYCGKKLIAGIAESFYNESFDEIMLEKYGQESVYLLNRGILLSNPMWSSQLNLTK